MTKMKKVLSLVLAFVMTASLFSNWDLKAFATSGEAEALVIPEGAELFKIEITPNNKSIVSFLEIYRSCLA